MKRFELSRPRTVQQAVKALQADQAQALAGGMDLIPSLQENVVEASRVVNLKTIADDSLRGIRSTPDGIEIGSLTTLSEIVDDATIRSDYASLAEAAETVGSPQIRNVGTLGGNLCQRPRCWYFRNEHYECLKKGGARCFAYDDNAENRYNAILGGGPAYIVHPSNCATSLVALDATVAISGPNGDRTISIDDFFVLPRVRLLKENVLDAGEIVTRVTIPTPGAKTRSAYVDFAEKNAFDWALSGAAVSATFQGDRVSSARILLHAVAPVPWRALKAERIVAGTTLDEATRHEAAEAALEGAEPLSQNGYKIPLTKAMVREALSRIA